MHDLQLCLRPILNKTFNICTLTLAGPDQANQTPPHPLPPNMSPSLTQVPGSIRGRSGGVIYSTITTVVARHPKKDVLDLIILNAAASKN